MFEFVLILFIALLISVSLLLYMIRKETDKLQYTTSTKRYGYSPLLPSSTKSLEKEIRKLTVKIRLMVAILLALIGMGLFLI